MPNFKAKVDLVLDGEAVEIRTNYQDYLNAERALGKNIAEAAVEYQGRAWFAALRRQYPDHPAAKNFRAFAEMIDAGDEAAADEDDGLDPIRPAGSDA